MRSFRWWLSQTIKLSLGGERLKDLRSFLGSYCYVFFYTWSGTTNAAEVETWLWFIVGPVWACELPGTCPNKLIRSVITKVAMTAFVLFVETNVSYAV